MSEFVYLLRSGDTTKYKIGRTNDLASRLKTLNGKQSADEILLVFSIEVIDSPSIEKTLQNKYKKYHHRNEWFKLTDEQVENVIEDMNFLQFNEQIFYGVEYKGDPSNFKKLEEIQEKIKIHQKNEMYDVDKIILNGVFRILQIAFIKEFIKGQQYLDIGINFFLQKQYELALVCFDIAIAFDENNWLAYYWKAESCHQNLEIKSRKKSNNQFVIDEIYRHNVIGIIGYYSDSFMCAKKNYEQIPNIHNKINLARASHLLGNYIIEYLVLAGGQDNYSHGNIKFSKYLTYLVMALNRYTELNFLNSACIVEDEMSSFCTKIRKLESILDNQMG
jgi:tetratricopeptide (TPR) repeat protein